MVLVNGKFAACPAVRTRGAASAVYFVTNLAKFIAGTSANILSCLVAGALKRREGSKVLQASGKTFASRLEPGHEPRRVGDAAGVEVNGLVPLAAFDDWDFRSIRPPGASPGGGSVTEGLTAASSALDHLVPQRCRRPRPRPGARVCATGAEKETSFAAAFRELSPSETMRRRPSRT